MDDYLITEKENYLMLVMNNLNVLGIIEDDEVIDFIEVGIYDVD